MKHLKNSILILLIFTLLSTASCNFVSASQPDKDLAVDSSDTSTMLSNPPVDTDNVVNTSSIDNTTSSANATVAQVDVNVKDVATKTPSNLLMDVDSGDILYAKNAFQKMYPASTTKLMTAILVLENCNLNDIVTVSHNAIFSIPAGYSHASLKEGEELTVEQLMNVLMVPSANDAAVALAEHIAGSVEDFSKMMNDKAKELGCINTHFVNPNGIHNKNHYSCAYDLALIGKYAMKFPDIMRFASVRQYTLPATNQYKKEDRIFNATNALLDVSDSNYYEYATGLKTGYTDSAGSCIVATAKKEDRDLLVVILNADSIDDRYGDCKKLFEYGFNEYSYQVLNKAGETIKTVEISNGTKETRNLDLTVHEDIAILLKNDNDIASLEPVIEINEDVRAPISENQVIGKITYTVSDRVYYADLVASSDVISASFETFLFRTFLIFLVLYVIYLILKYTGNKKPMKKDNMKDEDEKDIEKVHHGSGKFKFTQIHDYLN